MQLRLVCKAFHDMLDSSPSLSAQLQLSSTFSSHSLPSLLTWFENRAKSVTSFKARCSSASLDVALGGMLCCRSKLLWVDCSNCVASSLILLLDKLQFFKHDHMSSDSPPGLSRYKSSPRAYQTTNAPSEQRQIHSSTTATAPDRSMFHRLQHIS